MVYLGGLASRRLRGGSRRHKAQKAKAEGGVQVVGSSHSSAEAGESRWSEGEDISFVSFDETLWDTGGPL